MSMFVAADFIKHLECDLDIPDSILNNVEVFSNIKNIISLLNVKKKQWN